MIDLGGIKDLNTDKLIDDIFTNLDKFSFNDEAISLVRLMKEDREGFREFIEDFKNESSNFTQESFMIKIMSYVNKINDKK